jgi:hypothetical protein
MLNALTQWFCRSPRRLVLLGLCFFFLGALLMLGGAVAQAVAVPLPLVPESAWGFTASASLVCWGVWALGAGLRLRGGAGRAAAQALHRRG